MKILRRHRRSGFTLVEMLVTMAILGLVVAGAWSIFILFARMWNSGAAQLRAAVKTDRAVNYILFGGPGASWGGIRDCSITNSTLTTSAGGWVFTSGTNQLNYSSATFKITDAYGVAITDDLLLSTAQLINGGVRIMIAEYEASASYNSTNVFTAFGRMRNQ